MAPEVSALSLRDRPHAICSAAQTGAVASVAPARAQYGPGVLATGGGVVCGHYLAVARATRLMASTLGVGVSTGFMAGVRARAAGHDSIAPTP
jgi:hypothetical protein